MKNHIRKHRNKLGLTQKDLCEILGWTIRRLQSYERGVRMPSVYDALVLAEALCVAVDDLFEI
jgi:transcriptional regulator with XRE-family HTH domain